jgi:four helix bundle protein
MAQDLAQRTFSYALSVARLIPTLPHNIVNMVYFSQLIRCSSSVGANYRATKRAKSTRDFLNKLKTVEEEADESVFFLELLKELNQHSAKQVQGLIDEGYEILRIIVASIKTVKAKLKAKDN